MNGASASEMVLAFGLIAGLATGAQVIAQRLKIPGLVLLLPIGFTFGVIAPELRMTNILGDVFPVVVDLLVAVILFQGGMDLTSIPLARGDKSIARRLVWVGGAVTCIAAAMATHYILGMSWSLAFMLGAILIVSGPTVVTPILDFARPNTRLRGVLMWEGTLLDPLGALVAVGVFQIIAASSASSTWTAIGDFFASFLTALVVGSFGVLLFVVGGHLAKGNQMLGTQVLLGSVLLSAGVANAISPNSGLLTALLLGVSAPKVARKFGASLTDAQPFFNTVVSIGIGVLFISIAALVPYEAVMSILWPTLLIAGVLIVIVRPLVAAVTTAGSNLSLNERAFVGWMDPRGIVAAATASSVGASLVAAKVEGAAELLPAAFIIIFVTVVVYSLTAAPVASALKVRDSSA